MTEYNFWLVVAGLLLVAEITSGTFYLLLISIGAALGAMVAYLGYSLELQIATVAIFATAASFILRRIRSNNPATGSNPRDDKLDIGNLVEVKQWDNEGRAQVLHRGAFWQALSEDENPVTGLHQVVDLQSNTLILKRYSKNSV